MLPAGAWEYRSARKYPLAPMCVITLRVFATKEAPSRKNISAPQIVSTPLIQINVRKLPENIALPLQYTRQAPTVENIPSDPSGSTPEPCSAPPAASAATALPVPDQVPAAPPLSKTPPEQQSRRSSIRKGDHPPNSNGSRSPKKVRFSISEPEDSLASPNSASSSFNSGLHVTPPPDPSRPNAMAVEDKTITQAPPSGDVDEWETGSDFSSDIDDGEMVQYAVRRETQGDNDYLYKMDWGDMDSDSGSAVDGSEPALSVPVKHDDESRPAFAQPPVRKGENEHFASSGHAVHRNANESHYSSGKTFPTKAHAAPSIRQSMRHTDWENDSEAGSTMDENRPANQLPLSSHTAGNGRRRDTRFNEGQRAAHVSSKCQLTL